MATIKTEQEILAELTKIDTAKKTTAINSIDYSFVHKCIKNGTMNADTMNLKSYNNLFDSIKKLSEADYVLLKSDEPEKKVIRKYFQNIGKGQGLTPAERKKMQADKWQLFRDLHAIRNKK